MSMTIAAPVQCHQDRIDRECQQLLLDIRRIGDVEGAPYVTFGQLFEDEGVVQYYEALLGTLKSAKKRGLIQFKGQMLLKGVHDSVVISIVGAEGSVPQESSRSFRPPPNTAIMTPIRKWKRPVAVQPITSTVEASSQLNSKTYQGRKWSKPTSFSVSSATKSNLPIVTPTSSKVALTNKDIQRNHSKFSTLNKENSKTNFSSGDSTESASNLLNDKKQNRPLTAHSSVETTSVKSTVVGKGGGSDVDAYHSRHEQELVQLLKDIRRVGCSSTVRNDDPSSTESCRFGDLFDDPEVEQYYEALLGTLKSAKRRGLITFKGQMLLKGMHDNVVIRIVSNNNVVASSK